MLPEEPEVFKPQLPSPRTGTTDAAELYNAMLETMSTGLISGIKAQTFDGQLLYKEAPLGYRGAITPIVIEPGGVDPFTGRKLKETWFQIDPSLKPKDPLERRLEQISAVSRAIPGLGSREMQDLLSQYGPSSKFIGPNDPVYSEDGADRLLRNIAGNVNDLAMLKSKLIKTGFLTPTEAGPLDIVYLDEKIFKEFRNAVDVAQSNDMKIDAFLDDMVSRGGRVTPAKPERAPTIRLTSAEDLKQVANSVAQRQIGRRLEDEELDKFAQAYQQTEAQFQRRLLGGGTVTAPPSIDVAAQQMVEQERPEEADLYSLGSTLDTFTQMLGGM
jgi:hypothetical protein